MVGGQILTSPRGLRTRAVDVARMSMKTGPLRYGCIAGAILGQSSRQEYQASTITPGSARPLDRDTFARVRRRAHSASRPDRTALGKTLRHPARIDGAKHGHLLAAIPISIFGAKGDVARPARLVGQRKNEQKD